MVDSPLPLPRAGRCIGFMALGILSVKITWKKNDTFALPGACNPPASVAPAVYFLPRSIFCRAHSTRSCQQSGSLRHSRSATPHIACSTDAAPSPTGKPRSRQLCNPHGQGAGALGRETRAGGACGQRSRVPGEEKQVATCLHVRPRLATPTTGMYNAMRSCQEVPGTLNLDPGALC